MISAVPALSAFPMSCRSTVPCNLCQGTEVDVVGTRDRDGRPLRTVLCRGCGLVWTDPRPSSDQTREFYAHEYRVKYKSIDSPKPKHAYRETLRAITRIRELSEITRPGQKFLDIGAGGGFFVYALQRAGFDACGLEPNQGYADYARSVLQVPVQNAFLQDVEFEPRSFDVITLIHVLEHLEDPAGALQRLAGWLRPEGYLVVEVPNIESRHHSPERRYHIGHLYHFNLRTLAGIGQKAGLDLFESRLLNGPRHCHVIFQKPEVPSRVLPDFKSVYNARRVSRALQQHTVLSHYLSPAIYLRVLKKNLRCMEEWQQTFGQRNARLIVDNVVRKTAENNLL